MHPSTTPPSTTHPLAFITGGSRGLGRASALHLARAGWDIILSYRSREDLAREVVTEIQALGRKAAALPLDTRRTAGFPALAASLPGLLHDTFGRDRLDALVNNAGTGADAAFLDTTEAQFDQMMNEHLKGVFFLTQALAPLLADGARILNVSSGLTRFSFPGKAAYAVMKGGVEVLTRYLAKELGPRGIRANVLAPGAIATDFGGGIVRDDPQVGAAIAGSTALGRVGEADDIGGAVAALLAPGSAWINGQRIEASGGMLL
ncbi:SDR family NAD(P)-dependent oxidoreductase [Castellaniella ginsengisoli]|uniref:SDR family oxidoreductase n=1 Tax=Castellaniella ginsengisoli TaxID=546114 RepID=A0AB39D7I5_9BURK